MCSWWKRKALVYIYANNIKESNVSSLWLCFIYTYYRWPIYTCTFAICNLRHLAEQIILIRICFFHKIFKIRIKHRHRWTSSRESLQGMNKKYSYKVKNFLMVYDILNIDKALRRVTHREKYIQKDYENYQHTFRAACIFFNLQSALTSWPYQKLIKNIWLCSCNM